MERYVVGKVSWTLNAGILEHYIFTKINPKELPEQRQENPHPLRGAALISCGDDLWQGWATAQLLDAAPTVGSRVPWTLRCQLHVMTQLSSTLLLLSPQGALIPALGFEGLWPSFSLNHLWINPFLALHASPSPSGGTASLLPECWGTVLTGQNENAALVFKKSIGFLKNWNFQFP